MKHLRAISGLSVVAALVSMLTLESPDDAKAQDTSASGFVYGACGIFVLDASGSISDGIIRDKNARQNFIPEYIYNAGKDDKNLQLQGYIEAFEDPVIKSLVMMNAPFRIQMLAFNDVPYFLMEGIDGNGWSTIDTEADYDAFLAMLKNSDYKTRGMTDVSQALLRAVNNMNEGCEYINPSVKFIDLATDGLDSYSNNPSERGSRFKSNMRRVRSSLGNITINGLVMGLSPDITLEELQAFHYNYVKSRDGFVKVAFGREDLRRAIKEKIKRELQILIVNNDTGQPASVYVPG